MYESCNSEKEKYFVNYLNHLKIVIMYNNVSLHFMFIRVYGICNEYPEYLYKNTNVTSKL